MENETTTVQARMNHPAFAVPGGFEAMVRRGSTVRVRQRASGFLLL